MSAPKISVDDRPVMEKEIVELETALAALQEKLAASRSQLGQCQEQTAKAAGEVDRCRTAYQGECRKLAAGQKQGVRLAKTALDEAEERWEGLKLLLADEDGALAALQEQCLPVETRLRDLRHAQKVEWDGAEIAALGQGFQGALDALQKQGREAIDKLFEGKWAGDQNTRAADRLRRSINGFLGQVRGTRVL